MRHRFHSMCPYFAMFPESFAEHWIGSLTKPGDTVLDPFAGRGTAPFQALLMDRRGVGGDVNPVAACLNKAKLETPSVAMVSRRLARLEKEYEQGRWTAEAADTTEFFQFAFNRQTLAQMLYVRSQLDWENRRVDAFIAALVLGALHGEASSRRYLSNQMPRTISTKPEYSVRFWKDRNLEAPHRNLFDVIREALAYRFASAPPSQRGRAIYGDMRGLPLRWRGELAALVVTSPPYGAVTSYEEDQWLRLWFLGGYDRPGKSRVTRDDRLVRLDDYWKFIGDFWRILSAVCQPNCGVIIRVGAARHSVDVLTQGFLTSSLLGPRKAELVSAEVSQLRRRQTQSFRPGSKGVGVEVDLHFMLA